MVACLTVNEEERDHNPYWGRKEVMKRHLIVAVLIGLLGMLLGCDDHSPKPRCEMVSVETRDFFPSKKKWFPGNGWKWVLSHANLQEIKGLLDSGDHWTIDFTSPGSKHKKWYHAEVGDITIDIRYPVFMERLGKKCPTMVYWVPNPDHDPLDTNTWGEWRTFEVEK